MARKQIINLVIILLGAVVGLFSTGCWDSVTRISDTDTNTDIIDTQSSSDSDTASDTASDSDSDSDTGTDTVVKLCTVDADCLDSEFCNGEELCDTDKNECVSGISEDLGTSCVFTGNDTDTNTDGFCMDDQCRKPQCENDTDCLDANVCDGTESCNVAKQCISGTDADRGTPCDADANPSTIEFCDDGTCNVSQCGDMIVDTSPVNIDTDTVPLEQCDDGDTENGDGCDNNCHFSCVADSNCMDSDECTIHEICDTETHMCLDRWFKADGDACGVAGSACRQGRCGPVNCGNGELDTETDTSSINFEECDDGNVVNGDGCESLCTYTCKVDDDCDDINICNGLETCDTDVHICVAGTGLTCEDNNSCTHNECDPVSGCVFPLIDYDGDGQAAESLDDGTCLAGQAIDCNDSDPDIYKDEYDSHDLCDDGIDNDCDGQTDEDIPYWYLDCDGDGYAESDEPSEHVCGSPGIISGCDGGWTTLYPLAGVNVDCIASNGNVNPGQTAYFTTAIPGQPSSTDFDYNCDGVEAKHYSKLRSTSCTSSIYYHICQGRSGWTTSVPGCGNSSNYQSCSYNWLSGSCEFGSVYTRVQECR